MKRRAEKTSSELLLRRRAFYLRLPRETLGAIRLARKRPRYLMRGGEGAARGMTTGHPSQNGRLLLGPKALGTIPHE
jgi:hypothetical protein